MSDADDGTSLYGYTPTSSICVAFILLFGVSTLIHGCEAVAYKLWWLLPLACLAGLGETIGWIARFYSSLAPASLDAYITQMCATIIAPTPLIASNFMILSIIIQHLGAQYSRLSPKLYSIIFTTADIIALLVQGFGGFVAAKAVSNNGDPDKGGHIMLIGIITQMVSITIYVALASEFLFRFFSKRPLRRIYQTFFDAANDRPYLTRKIKLMMLCLGISTILLFIRTIYRTAELVNGFEGTIIQTQVLFNVFDGAMVLLASFTLNLLHPGYLLAEVIEEQKLLKGKTILGRQGIPMTDSDAWVDGKDIETTSGERMSFMSKA